MKFIEFTEYDIEKKKAIGCIYVRLQDIITMREVGKKTLTVNGNKIKGFIYEVFLEERKLPVYVIIKETHMHKLLADLNSGIE